MYSGHDGRSSENWHYDKYKDPHEFPILADSSDEEDRSDNDSRTAHSSANLSKKLPQISDEKFKQILELRKLSKGRGKSLTVSNKINDLPQPLHSDKPIHEDERKERPSAHGDVNTTENLLSASTPKVNNTTTFTEEASSPNNAKLSKNISRLLLQQDEQKSSPEKNANNDGMDTLIQTLQEQMQRIKQLETKLNKSKIQIVNLESKIVILENENGKLFKKSEQLKSESIDMSNYQSSLMEEISYLRAEREESGNKIKQSSDRSVKLENELKKERILLNKERDMHKKIIQNYDSKLESLHNENLHTLNLLEQEQSEKSFWKKKLDMFEKECKILKEKEAHFETDKAEAVKQLGIKIEAVRSECSLLKERNQQLLRYENDYASSTEDLKKVRKNLEEISKIKDDLQFKLDNLAKQNTDLTTDNVTLKAELTTKLEILQNELVKVKEENYNLNIGNQSLKSEIHILNETQEDFKKKMLGGSPITDEQFGPRYKSLEMDQVDKLTLMELQNIVKNILSSLNIKYSSLKGHIVFIRDYVFVFFNEMHSILHSEKRGNSVIIDRSIKLDTSDESKMKACMDLLLKDVKKLKGITD